MEEKRKQEKQNSTNRQKKSGSQKKADFRQITNALKGIPLRIHPVDTKK